MTDHPTTERDLGRVEGKLDLLILLVKGNQADHSSLRERVTALEKKVLVALCTGGGGFAAYAFDAKQLILGLFH